MMGQFTGVQRILLSSLLFSFLFSNCNGSILKEASTPAPRTDTWASVPAFPLGVFEDANLLNGNPEGFRKMIVDLQSRGLDSVMFANNFSERDRPLFEVADEMGFNVYPSPNGDLAETWWPSEVPANMDHAVEAARPIVERWSAHPSVKGYISRDEPGRHESRKVSLIHQAFRQLDADRPVMPILIGVNRVSPIFQESNPSG